MKTTIARLPIGLLGLVLASVATAATAPYADPFQDTTIGSTPSGWTTFGATGTTALVQNSGSANYLQLTGSNTAGSFGSTVQLTNMDSSIGGFTISTSFRINDGTSNTGGEYIGLSAFSLNTAMTGSYYLADIQRNSGNIRILSLGATNADFSSPDNSLPGSAFTGGLVANTDYTLSIVGTYTGASLSLTFSVSNGTTTKSITATDATPLTGTNFGYRLNNTTGSDPLGVQFASYAVSAIPEPSTYAACLGAAVGMMALVRRRRQSARQR